MGVLVSPAVTLEILPKIESDCATVRRNLVHLIAALWDLPLSAQEASVLDTQNRDIVEILVARFARDLLTALRRGMPRRYASTTKDLPALRGRLNVERQFTVRAGRADRQICRHDVFSGVGDLARVLKASARLLMRLTRVLSTGRSLSEALLFL